MGSIRWTIYRALCTFSVEKSTLIMAWDKFFFWSNQAAAGQVRKSITSNNVSAPGLRGTSAGRLMSAEHIVEDRVIPGWPTQPLITSCLAFNAFNHINTPTSTITTNTINNSTETKFTNLYKN